MEGKDRGANGGKRQEEGEKVMDRERYERYVCPGLCKWMLVGMGWEWRSAAGQLSRDVLEKVDHSWAVTQAWLSRSPRLPERRSCS